MTSMGANADEVMVITQRLRHDDYASLGETVHG